MTTALVVDLLLLAAAAAVSLPIAVLFVECMAALPAARRRNEAAASPPAKIAVLIPAHNEEAGIAATLRGIRPQLRDGDRAIVVADNCTDATADRARSEEAEVLERRDENDRGKGFALAHGLRHLRAAPPEIVIFVDADTAVGPGSIDALRTAAASSRRPVQAVYLLDPPSGAGATAQISAFAFLVKNRVRPLGLSKLGVPCALVGTGMAVPWTLIDIDRLATGNIVEDLQFGIDLAVAGHPPMLCPEATVKGTFPSGPDAARVQRTRWEHGHLGTLLTQVPRLAWQAVRQGRSPLFEMALDLAVPPLALLCLLWFVVAAAAGTALVWRRGLAAGITAAVAGLLLLGAVGAAWARHGRGVIRGRVLLLAPIYILWKIPLYAAFLFRRQKAWVRTERK